jgi:hypothetical protein
MNRIKIIIVLGTISFVLLVTDIFTQTITVSGAGTEVMNGIYTLDGTYNGKSYYAKDLNRRFIIWGYNSPNIWEILDSTLPQSSYTHSANTTNPPQTGWTVAAQGSPPAPTLSGSGTAVELYSFTASQCTEGIYLNWTTASEVNAVGFIIDRKSSQVTDWQLLN